MPMDALALRCTRNCEQGFCGTTAEYCSAASCSSGACQGEMHMMWWSPASIRWD